MAKYDVDYFVIGGGSGGVRSARIAARHGARVALAEERYLGGTCVNVGCVPKKLLVIAAGFARDFADAAGFGWTVGEPRHSWGALIANKNIEIERLNQAYRQLLDDVGVEIIDARATLVDANTVAIGERRITAEHILVATGGWPIMPEDVPGAQAHAITSNEAFFLEKLPERVVIVGGGYVGVEFAGIFHGLGSKVTLVHRGPMFLRGFDDDLRQGLAAELAKQGVALRFGTTVERIDREGETRQVMLSDGSRVDADLVMFAIGRRPSTAGLGLETVGVLLGPDGAIVVDEHYRTSVPNIYAIGDVVDRIALTPVAIAEGHVLADALFGKLERDVAYAVIPTAVFSLPPVSSVGLTEDEARARHAKVDIYRAAFRAMRNTLSGRDERTLIKLIVDGETDRVLGAHMLGADAPEIIQGLAIALTCGATKAQFDRTIGLHPTAAEEFVTLRTKSA